MPPAAANSSSPPENDSSNITEFPACCQAANGFCAQRQVCPTTRHELLATGYSFIILSTDGFAAPIARILANQHAARSHLGGRHHSGHSRVEYAAGRLRLFSRRLARSYFYHRRRIHHRALRAVDAPPAPLGP